MTDKPRWKPGDVIGQYPSGPLHYFGWVTRDGGRTWTKHGFRTCGVDKVKEHVAKALKQAEKVTQDAKIPH